MTRSMAPTLAKLDRLAQRTPSEISGTNYRLGHDYGYRKGVYHTLMAVTAVMIMGCGVVAWVIG